MSLCRALARRLPAPQPTLLRVSSLCGVRPNSSLATKRTFHAAPILNVKKAASPKTSKKEKAKQDEENPVGREDIGAGHFADFELTGKVFVVTGGAHGLGLGLAEALVEAGGKGQTPEPTRKEWRHALERVVPEAGGSLHYRPHDPSEPDQLQQLIKAIAEESGRLDGLVAAAAYEELELDTPYRARLTFDFTGVVQACTAAAQEMMTRQTRGTIVLVAHMSSMVASRAPLAAVLSAPNAALVQLARDLATRWSPIHPGGGGGIRVNCLSPGNILMGQTAFEKEPYLKEHWARENVMGRLADISEFKSAVLFLSSKASSFMTGSNLVIDGGRKQQ